jgi:thiamine-phosphate diphosphorylase/hydroxyethylthiazole kinase
LRNVKPLDLLNEFQASVIKGNAGELAALGGSLEVKFSYAVVHPALKKLLCKKVESKGVDSMGNGFKDPVEFVRNLARKERRCLPMFINPSLSDIRS